MVKILLRCGVSLRRRGDTLSRKERKQPPKGVSAYAASRSALCGRRKDRTFVRSVDDARVLRRKRPSRLRPEGHVRSPLGERYLPAEGERLRGKFRFGAFSPQRHQERPRRRLRGTQKTTSLVQIDKAAPEQLLVSPIKACQDHP